ncbi:MAG: hypothetical protein HUJ76_05415 [Parasporobacterium sp.]|nr:hypothetical protein [Parasporobacterium sp.]
MKEFIIDDITWNDLSMDSIYDRLNRAESSVGSEYLKRVMRTMLMDGKQLEKRSDAAEMLKEHEPLRKGFSKVFRNLGKTKKLSLYDYIFRFSEVKNSGNALHYILALLMLASIAALFISPVAGVIGLVIMFIVNISTYFKFKASVEGYFMCFKYIIRMVRAASDIRNVYAAWKKNSADCNTSAMDELIEEMSVQADMLKELKTGSWLLTNSVSGSLVDVVMDYIRMLFHVDIIRFNSMLKTASARTENIDRLFCLLGELETRICIALFRQSAPYVCLPVLQELQTGAGSMNCINQQADDAGRAGSESSADERYSEDPAGRGSIMCSHIPAVKAVGMYHPLLKDSVPNDINVSNPVLLTGSNASGKSTFLKQLAVNQIFAQTLYTCTAREFRSGFFRVISSMALTDNILGNESYFIVEIKSLKRIFDTAEEGRAPVMCFIDEVLRGTNTKERIAASVQILRKLSEINVLCFAATHDIELTELLKDVMDNYHFEETVSGSDVMFDYKLKKGPAETRNAIKLMRAYGFDRDITDGAEKLADALG